MIRLILPLGLVLSWATELRADGAAVDFGRDIQPLLANYCYHCHGADEATRKARLRLDTLEGATARLRRGRAAIVPGDSSRSTLLERVSADDDSVRMPPPQTGQRLTAAQVELLRRWIEQGAAYQPHWAFVPPVRPSVPRTRQPKWVRNPIDAFVLARLEREGLQPAPEAERATLVRRLYLDLIGLPPSPAAVEAALKDPSPDWYERLVDRLLASPHYGERWARRWLDLARYADTNGYEKDRPRSIWPYRDWVINALNRDLPFDQFTIEQLAGDLLPDATPDQLIATGFHRNTLVNEEGGIDTAEDRFKALVDRVNTTGAAWLGLTVGCAQCHTHKYDPLSQRDYYGLFAFLNNTDELEMEIVTPEIARQREARLNEIRTREAARAQALPDLPARLAQWEQAQRPHAVPWQSLRPVQAVSAQGATLTVLADDSVLAGGDKPNWDSYELLVETDLPRLTALRLEALCHPSLPDGGPGRAHFFARGDFFLSEVVVEAAPKGSKGPFVRVPLMDPSADHAAPGRDIALALDGRLDTGWMIKGQEGRDHRAVFPFRQPVGFPGGTVLKVRLDQYHIHQVTLGRFRLAVTAHPGPVKAAAFPADVEAALLVPAGERTAAQQEALKAHYLSVAPELAEANKQLAELRRSLPQYPTTLVLQERPPEHARLTRRYHRGEFLHPREIVPPATPPVLHPLDNQAAPPGNLNRLTLARWLMDRRNPLTARVVMNRQWQAFFGRGIVATLEDFGTRGDRPTHPELLDWLAVEFRDGGWSVKRMHRLLVTSATYRQDARVTPQLLEKDPGNALYARGARFRLEAEMIRDLALTAAGLLVPKLGGPSVFPPQPPEVTSQVYGDGSYPTSRGPDRYRRGLYTYWKRTAPFAAAITFDAPAADVACVCRVRSNTPLQALTLLNDEVFVEAAAALARRVLREAGPTSEERVRYLFLAVLSRPPVAEEVQRVRQFYQVQVDRFRSGTADARAVAGPGAADGDPNELAAWTLVCRAVLNLDEAITRG